MVVALFKKTSFVDQWWLFSSPACCLLLESCWTHWPCCLSYFLGKVLVLLYKLIFFSTCSFIPRMFRPAGLLRRVKPTKLSCARLKLRSNTRVRRDISMSRKVQDLAIQLLGQDESSRSVLVTFSCTAWFVYMCVQKDEKPRDNPLHCVRFEPTICWDRHVFF